MNDTVLCTRPEAGVALVTLNRPERINAITNEMLDRLLAVLVELGTDASVRVVVLTGAGKGFCGGLDVKENMDALGSIGSDIEGAMTWARRFGMIAPTMRALPQPIIAAVNGTAIGGGFMLALAADLRVASRTARFSNGFLNIGASGCELGLSFLLPRQIGMARAMELALTGRVVDAPEAERIGLVSAVAEGDVLDTAYALARQICAGTPFGIQLTKELLWTGVETPSLDAAVALEARSQLLALMTADGAARRATLFEKRPTPSAPAGA